MPKLASRGSTKLKAWIVRSTKHKYLLTHDPQDLGVADQLFLRYNISPSNMWLHCIVDLNSQDYFEWSVIEIKRNQLFHGSNDTLITVIVDGMPYITWSKKSSLSTSKMTSWLVCLLVVWLDLHLVKLCCVILNWWDFFK